MFSNPWLLLTVSLTLLIVVVGTIFIFRFGKSKPVIAVIGGIVAFCLLEVSFSLSSIQIGRMNDNLNSTVVNLATTVVDLQHGINTVPRLKRLDNQFLAPTVWSQLATYQHSLLQLNNATVNLSQLYSHLLAVSTLPSHTYGSAGEVGGVTHSSHWSAHPAKVSASNPAIFYRHGLAYIYVRNLKFAQGNAIVPFKGRSLLIPQSSVPETYTQMASDPDTLYTLSTLIDGHSQNGSTSFTSAVFRSVLTGKQLVVQVYFNSSDIVTGFAVVN